MAVDCKNNSKKLRMYGFGIPGQGFYSFNLPESSGKVIHISGILTVIDGEATEERVDKELKNLVRDNWDFRVRKMDDKDYLVVFPDKTSLDTFTKLRNFGMPLYGLTGRLEKSRINPKTSSVLQTVWIKIHNVPDVARDVEIIKEITSLVAEPLVVDELSLVRAEPVRVKGRCRNPAALRGSIEYFFNGEGVLLRFEVEEGRSVGKGGKGGPPPPGHGHGPGGSGGGSNDQDKQSKGGNTKKGSGKFDRFGRIDKEGDSSHDGSMEEDMEVNPIAAFHPDLGMVQMTNVNSKGIETEWLGNQENIAATKGGSLTLKGSGQNTAEEVQDRELKDSDSLIVVHGREGPYLMDKGKWPALKLPMEQEGDKEGMGELTQEETLMPTDGGRRWYEKEQLGMPCITTSPKPMHLDLGDLNQGKGDELSVEVEEDVMDTLSEHSKVSDREYESQGWQSPKTKRSKKRNKRKVVVATRTSSRIARDGIPVAQKAEIRAKAKNDFSGIHSSATQENPFTILNNASTICLHNVIADLDLEVENIDDQIDIFRTEELARAAIAEANYKCFLEKQREKTQPHDDLQTGELAMMVITNNDRDVPVGLSKGGVDKGISKEVVRNKEFGSSIDLSEGRVDNKDPQVLEVIEIGDVSQ
jgi:hypothetical protein